MVEGKTKKPMGWRITLCLLSAVILPFGITTIYLVLAGSERQRSGSMDILVFACVLLTGLALIARSPMKWYYRVAIGLLYVPAIVCLLFVWGAMLVCGKYDDCL